MTNDSVQATGLDTEELRDWIQQQRWYASKSRSVAGVKSLSTWRCTSGCCGADPDSVCERHA